MIPEVTVAVTRVVDGIGMRYLRHCTEDDLDWIIAEEQNKPGRLKTLQITPPAG